MNADDKITLRYKPTAAVWQARIFFDRCSFGEDGATKTLAILKVLALAQQHKPELTFARLGHLPIERINRDH